MEGLRTWVPWIIVGAVGLGPILTFWIAMVLRLFLRGKLWKRRLIGPPNVRAPSATATMSADNRPFGGKHPAEAAD